MFLYQICFYCSWQNYAFLHFFPPQPSFETFFLRYVKRFLIWKLLLFILISLYLLILTTHRTSLLERVITWICSWARLNDSELSRPKLHMTGSLSALWPLQKSSVHYLLSTRQWKDTVEHLAALVETKTELQESEYCPFAQLNQQLVDIKLIKGVNMLMLSSIIVSSASKWPKSLNLLDSLKEQHS